MVLLLSAAASTRLFRPECANKASYDAPGGGIRRVFLPASACEYKEQPEAAVMDLIHALCCANTHTVCVEGRNSAELIAYSGQIFTLAGSAEECLQQSWDLVCGMQMAIAGGDCSTCSAERQAKSKIMHNSTASSGSHSGSATRAAFSVLPLCGAFSVAIGLIRPR